MNHADDRLGTLVSSALSAEARETLIDTVDLWPRVARGNEDSRAAMRRRHGGGLSRKTWITACVTIALTLGMSVGVVLASPAMERAVGALWFVIHPKGSGAEVTGRGIPIHLSPVPSFAVYYPKWLPPGLLIAGLGEFNTPTGKDYTFANISCPHHQLRCLPRNPSLGTTIFLPNPKQNATPTVVRRFALTNVNIVWFGRHALPPSKRFFQLAEWDAALYPVTKYPWSSIPRLHAGTRERRLSLVKDGTAIVVDSNLPIPVVRHLVRSLHRLEGRKHS